MLCVVVLPSVYLSIVRYVLFGLLHVGEITQGRYFIFYSRSPLCSFRFISD